ncbi:thermonuclease family protein [Arthrobacter sp. zg-Y1171]|uniref:thermonuclease family protein n=1 Tax=Arthrobacter sp. zg-Y1171 TaxID=2964610 RepID=UPI00210802C3|nr:thermonuclease family protein [Arthrobacter sp. zg-Y1171]MCQ1996835.1 thermonuclease family protein [Arthrobacter sp. zg-Y1171]UWX82427.1 thermonuclease family protein [Arthrobacter sp. zg-Y1171]
MISSKAALAAAAAVVVAASAVGCSSASTADKSNTAEVVRVIDGDTLVVDFENEELTVRLLNVDTPETKDPDKAVECLGPEATTFLEEALPPGSTVTLEFDVEREDRYGRTLAGVYDADDRLMNAEVARHGFGIPVTYEPNAKFRPPVDAAYEEARDNQAGLFSPEVECTVPAQVSALEDAAEEAVSNGTSAGIAAAVTAAYAVAKTVDEGFDALEAASKAGESMVWAALSETERASLMGRAAAAKTKIHSQHETLVALDEERLAAEEAQRQAAAEEERIAAEQAEANRIAAQAEADRQAAAQAEANRRAAAPAPAPQYVAPPAQTNPYPGYTGPRCYAPGGKSWKPC